ncbi:hypothetical protein [Prevotella sp. 10(H)]|uniref:hypothetical protein n=1 Tax=Prevotella sp. 10(H) TaxID=1158294 RepID=UPI0004A6B7F3|nr:hypothetical protein [Prevotella sp. 10(H)]
MRVINISNDRNRDAQIVFDADVKTRSTRWVLPKGKERTNVKLLKSAVYLEEEELQKKYGELTDVAEALIKEDPEVDMEIIGKILHKTHKLYVDKNNEIAYSINLYQVIYNPDGTEKERHDLNKVPANINIELPLKWTDKMFPKDEAIRKFVFSRKYQLRHINGVTFDFLYNMAKELHEAKSVVLIGAGKKGNEPILLTRGGEPYRGFLEGRIKDDMYSLILHLTDIELKPLGHETE